MSVSEIAEGFYNLNISCDSNLTIDTSKAASKCIHPGCDKRSSFGYVNQKAQYCTTHKLDGMIDVRSRKCIHPNCNKRPNFSNAGEDPRYCATHKLDGMIDVKSKRCIHPNCNKQPSFSNAGEDPQYCATHKLDGMTNVKSKRCIHPNCNKQPTFGKLFRDIVHCATHKSNNEFRNNRPKCQCGKDAYYMDMSPIMINSIPTTRINYPERCWDCKLDTDVNLVETECSNCKLVYLLNENTGLCNDCNEFIIHKVHHAKENRIKDILMAKGYIFRHDTLPRADNGSVSTCSKYRPDFVIDYKYFYIIIEVDEHQHKSYPKECDRIRMIQLHNDYGGIPLIFIRYNPDNYKNHLGETGKHNLLSRERILLELLQGLQNTVNHADIHGINIVFPLYSYYICYDGYNDNEPPKRVGWTYM